MAVITVHILVEGRVQGVFYRANTEQKARELKLKGSVKNLPNGSVEIYATGSEETLKELIDWCWEGPPLSKVSNITVTRLSDIKEFPSFKTIY